MLFSVIIPAYNVKPYLSDCLDSVLNQKFRDLEIILIDDGSTDGTSALCKAYSRTNSQIRLFYQKNSGLSMARNLGVKNAKGQYLLFLDGDDFLVPGSLSKLADSLRRYPNIDILRFQAQTAIAHDSGSRPNLLQITPYHEPGFSLRSGTDAFPLLARYHFVENAWCYCYRRAFFQEHHFVYARNLLAEDFGLTPLVIAQAHSVVAIPDIVYNYRQRPGSIMNDPARHRQRISDAYTQLLVVLPQLAKITHAEPISHFLLVSFLTAAASLSFNEFLNYWHQLNEAGLFCYIHPGSIRSLPRSLALRYSPRLFYALFRPKSSQSS